MEQFDETPVAESENEMTIAHLWNWCKATEKELEAEIRLLQKRLADLEMQRVANENNQDDPEWY